MAEIGASTATPNHGAISEETLMLDHLRRIERTRAGCCAIHIHLSQLQAPYRKPKFIRIAARSFDTLINNNDATLYVLANSDMALICRDVRVEDIDSAILKLRALFAEDPLAAEDSADGVDRFSTWYDLSDSTDFASFEEIGTRLELEGRQKPGVVDRNGKDTALPPLNSNALIQVERRLQVLRLSEFIRQQPAVDVRRGQGERKILFQEHFVGMGEIARRIAPDVDIYASPWLFHYVTDVLDRRMLAIVAHMNFSETEDPISLNLHVETVRSPEFQVFTDQIRPHADKVIVEVQMIDVIADLTAFNQAKKWLREQGYRILIDGLFPMALQYFDPGVLEPDFIKVNWSVDLDKNFVGRQLGEFRDMVDYAGRERVVLGRVESESAIRWGLKMGIHRFQGFFVDKLVDAMSAKGLL